MNFNNCIFCNNEINLNNRNLFLNRSFTSKFSQNKEINKENSHSFNLGSCSKCEIDCIVSDSGNKLLGFLNDKVKNREPDFHLIEVAMQIVNYLDVDKKFISIECMSYKDFFLENKIVELISKNNKKNLLRDKSQNKLHKKNEIQKIWIFRRYIEHIKNFKYLNDLLKRVKSGDLLIVEILDFFKLFKNKDISFIWDERVFYPSIDYILKFFINNGFTVLNNLNFDNDEPFSVIIFIKKDQKEKIKIPQNSYLNNSIDILFINNYLLTKASYFFKNYKNIAFFGAGHKSLTAINYLLNFFDFSNLSIFDSSKQKINSFWNNIIILDSQKCLNNKFDLYVFSYTGKNANLTREMILNSNPQAKFMNISDFFKYE